MVGIPMFSGFISKLFFAQAAVGHDLKLLPTVVALAISTILNALYFMKMVIRIYSPLKSDTATEGYHDITIKEQPVKSVAYVLFILLNLFMGLNSETIIPLIVRGLEMFS